MNAINRRRMLAMSIGAAACAAGIARADDSAGDGVVDAGTIDELRGTSVSDKLAKSKKVLIVRDGKRLIAVTAICTHKACGVKPHGDELRCPCHGSTFSTVGAVKKGPARTPLMHLGICLGASGHVLINPGQQFAQEQWNDPKSFIEIQ
jgi:Rieske Fe-S protein